MSNADKIVLAGYLVRCPLAGYAWQVLHYLAGLRRLGFDAYFYEDTAYFGDCFDPTTGDMHVAPDAGIAFAREFFQGFGFAGKWAFWDARRNRHAGLSAADTAALLHDARLIITLGPATRVPRRGRQRKVFIDIDPAFTQIRAAQGDAALCSLLAEHDLHFTIGENIGRADCTIPAGRFAWQPTRQPIATDLWEPVVADPRAAFSTIGRWDERRRHVGFGGEVYSWSKREEWMKFIDLPERTGERFTLAMDVAETTGDSAHLARHGWRLVDPLCVSRRADSYRAFIRHSKGEFTVAKDLNVRLASGWFSDRSACYLAAARPVVTQDTGFSRSLPTGSGLFSFRTLAEAVAAFSAIASDYEGHARAARAVAEEYFEAGRVLSALLNED